MIREIAFLMLDGSQLLDFAGPHDVFTGANQAIRDLKISAASTYKITVLSDSDSVGFGGGQQLFLGEAKAYRDFKRAVDTLIVVGGQNMVGSFPSSLLEWLKVASRKARRTVSICTGSFLMAQTGLLNGRTATTHWMYCDQFESRFPSVTVDRKSIFVIDSPFYTSAGVSSGIDLALALVEQDQGPEVALSVARGLVVLLRRPGNQNQFSHLLKQQHCDRGTFHKLVPWIMENLSSPLSIAALADHCAMSERNFIRKFKEVFAETPGRFLSNLRIEAAKRLLSETEQSVERISRVCGFTNVDIFRIAFLRNTGVNPSHYRKLWF